MKKKKVECGVERKEGISERENQNKGDGIKEREEKKKERKEGGKETKRKYK